MGYPRIEHFVQPSSIVRQIWGKADTVLFIFAGSAAEFALNKAVDWLYFTGRLPADPLGRLFSTVAYARAIIFADVEKAHRAIDSMAAIHAVVEANRGARIPDWAYRDVLFMLIDYSIRSFEMLERKLTLAEKEEVFDVFHRMATRMGLKDLPTNYTDWVPTREAHLREDLQHSLYTEDLFRQYRKHLGWVRYRLLREAQALIAPERVRDLLGFRKGALFYLLVGAYKTGRRLKADYLVKEVLLPAQYKKQIKALDIVPA